MVRALMAGTMASSTAWRARSSLVQWVRCNPRAMGSRQARATICARWRGGNPQRMSGVSAAVIGEQARQARLLVALAGPPDGGLIALHALGDAASPLAGRDGEHD